MSRTSGPDRRQVLTALAAGTAASSILRPRLAFAADDIPVGVLEPLTGAVAFAGVPGRNGAMMAIDAINAAGGIKSMGGAKLVARYYDTESNPQVGRARAEQAVSEGVAALIGSPQSAVGQLISQVAERAKIPNISDQGSGDFLTEQGWKYVFVVMPSNTQQARSDLDYIKNVGQLAGVPAVKTIGMVYEADAAGQQGFDVVNKLASQFGLEISVNGGYPHGATDVSGIVQRLKSAKPDFLLMYSFEADTLLFLRSMAEQGYTPPGVITKVFTDKIIQQAKSLAQSICQTTFYSDRVDPPGAPKGASKKFRDDYVKRFGEPFQPNSALTYTSVIVLANALERAGSRDPAKLRDALAATNLTGADGIMQIVDRIKFDETGRSVDARTLVDQLQGTQRPIVFPANVAETKPVYPMQDFASRT